MDHHTANARRKYHHVLTGGQLKHWDLETIVRGMEEKDDRIAELEAHCDSMEEIAANAGVELLRAEERIAELEVELANAQALKRSAYNAGYYQAECGLPAHGDIDKAATDALSGLVKRMCETQLAVERSLADRLYEVVMFRENDPMPVIYAYRKARGL